MESVGRQFTIPTVQAEEKALERTSEQQVPRTTHVHTKIASEFWLNIGGKEFRLVGKTIRIGRASDNDLVLDHKSCSRYHAIISFHDDRVIFEDLQSRNGITVNGVKVKRAELKDNDDVRVGDLSGIFFQKMKTFAGKPSAHIKALGAHAEVLLPAIEKMRANFQRFANEFQKADPKKKAKMAAIPLMVFLALMMVMAKSKRAVSVEEAVSEATEQTVDAAVDRKAFERCVELEDLGNFRQASACLKALPNTSEVQTVRLRVQKRQSEFSEKRFVEGTQAFENYYYDIAILKWQEVLLVSAEDSDFRLKAMSGIQEAEKRRKQR